MNVIKFPTLSNVVTAAFKDMRIGQAFYINKFIYIKVSKEQYVYLFPGDEREAGLHTGSLNNDVQLTLCDLHINVFPTFKKD